MKKAQINALFSTKSIKKILLIMKLTYLFAFINVLAVSAAAGYSQGSRLTLDMKDATIKEVLSEIENQTELSFIYKSDLINPEKKVNISVSDATIEQVLNKLFSNNEVYPRILDKSLIVLLPKELYPQQKVQVKGTVTDASTGNPLPGANITVKGTIVGVLTDAAGTFNIDAVDANSVLIVSFIGYLTQELPLNGKTEVDVKLSIDVAKLEEVVVIGYGVQKKVNLTGSVAAVKGDELANRAFSDTRQALQGMAPGMTIIDRGGVPGQEKLEMTLRGVGSLSAGTAPFVLIDGIEGSMNDINPNDIESISVLKDAASSAIYGSRAANGVILITTKRGKAGKTRITYDGYYGIQTPADLPESVSAEQYLRLVNEALVNAGKPAKYSDQYIQNTISGTDPINYPFVNQFKELFQNTPVQNHSFSLNGGNEKARVALSLNYLDQDGMLTNVNSKRYGVRLNTDIAVNNKLSISGDLNYIRRDTKQPTKLGSALLAMMNSSPVMVLKYPNGLYGLDQESNSALAMLEVGGLTKTQVENINAKIGAKYTFLNDFKAGVDVAYKSGLTRNKAYSADYIFYDPVNTSTIRTQWTPSSLTDSRDNYDEINLRATLDYDKKIGKHAIHVLGGTELAQNTDYILSASTKNLYSERYSEITTGDPATVSASGYKQDWALLSYFGRLNYNYSEKYFFEANVRYDGSSKFAEGHKWGFFPSFSAAWRLSNEEFMKSIPTISNLKIRGSWGQLGNQNIGNYRFASSIATYGSGFMGPDYYTYDFNDKLVPGYKQGTYANTDISWETSEMIDLGFDLSLFKGKIDLVADWFQKNTKDVLLKLPISSMVGLDASETNAGQIRNTGWEFTLTHNNRIGDFQYSVSYSLSDVKNELYDFAGHAPSIDGFKIKKEGEPIDAFYGYKCIGFFQSQEEINNSPTQPNQNSLKPGYLKFADLNGDDVINDQDKTVIGSSIPRFSTSLNINLGYKGFDLNAYFQGVMKADNYYYGAVNEGPDLEHFTTTRLLNRWTPTNNTDADFPLLITGDNTNNTLYSDFWVRDASYIRCKNLHIGYTVPASLVQRAKVEKLRFYVGVTNLFTITKVDPGIDPETVTGSAGTSSFAYPPVRTWSFGVQLGF
jgi:TonB-linked SusC/RagA family outer membrane protein